MPVADIRPIQIRSHQNDYNVCFARNLDDLMQLIAEVKPSAVLVDANVERLYRFSKVVNVPALIVEATEGEKTLDGIAKTINFLLQLRCNRHSLLLAVGGGIIQDIATFTSHVYYRGIRFALVPTTLLGMCDSCIGAKCGINFGGYKNQLGVFHSPSRVFLCTDFLQTLSDADIVSGYGEILKLMLIGSPKQYETLSTALETEGFRNSRVAELIRDSLLVKKEIIEEDEYESRLRMVLNYGHTFGHALESVTCNAVPHGLGVAWGIDLANHIASKRGILDRALFHSIHELRVACFPVPQANSVSFTQLIEAARRDKKSGVDAVTMALLKSPGQIELHEVGFDERLEKDIEEFLKL